MGNKRFPKIIIPLLCVLAVASAAVYAVFSQESENTFWAMDTVCSVKVRGPGAVKAAEKTNEIAENLDSSVLSRHASGSLTYVLNEKHGGEVPEDGAAYIQELFRVYQKSGGAFDFTLGELSDLWGIGGDNPRVPAQDEITAVLSRAGADKITFDGRSISFPEGVSLDFGASGKGIALDEIKKAYDEMKVRRAVVSLGGSVMLYGRGEFSVGIQNPGGTGYMALLTLGEGFVSTSGSYERFFEQDGVRYHHIFDPATGYPADSGLVSVTVVSDSGILSDALSTACFVLGAEEGARLCDEFGCGGVFIDKDGAVTTTGISPEALEITDGSFHIEDR